MVAIGKARRKSMSVDKRIEAAVKMLFASGRQLDIEAAKLIEELNQKEQKLGRQWDALAEDIQPRVVALEEELVKSRAERDAARNKVADLYIERDQAQSNADNLADENNALRDEIDELSAKLDAVGPMRRDKAEERFEEMQALVEENKKFRQEIALHYQAMGRLGAKLHKALGKPIGSSDSVESMVDEVDREMLVLKVKHKIAYEIGESQLKSHQDYCAANHVSAQQVESWKSEAEGWKCLDRIFAEDGDETPGT
jgi:chromosome segregation ATPase